MSEKSRLPVFLPAFLSSCELSFPDGPRGHLSVETRDDDRVDARLGVWALEEGMKLGAGETRLHLDVTERRVDEGLGVGFEAQTWILLAFLRRHERAWMLRRDTDVHG